MNKNQADEVVRIHYLSLADALTKRVNGNKMGAAMEILAIEIASLIASGMALNKDLPPLDVILKEISKITEEHVVRSVKMLDKVTNCNKDCDSCDKKGEDAKFDSLGIVMPGSQCDN
jgi:hypothetical protein